ncbi:hypothetical protein [Streptomyces sp. NPDC002889]|uniref:hypothetical protein n=1 Tax=Streptomyces sp. NPDC002889 TaxID=3364669 RepID=UPI0036A9F93A
MLVDDRALHCAMITPEMLDTSRGQPPAPAPQEPRGCLFALSQPPLMIFLGVIGFLLLMAAVHDLFLL